MVRPWTCKDDDHSDAFKKLTKQKKKKKRERSHPTMPFLAFRDAGPKHGIYILPSIPTLMQCPLSRRHHHLSYTSVFLSPI